MKWLFIAMTLCVSSAWAGGRVADLPDGWGELRLADFKGTEYYQLRETKEKGSLEVDDDFDGDGRLDAARFLVKEEGREYALFISTSKDGKDHKYYSAPSFDEIARLGIGPIPSGTYDTACGKGYGNCDSEEPAKIVLKNPGFSFFTFESASSIIYWDDKHQKFEEVATSD